MFVEKFGSLSARLLAKKVWVGAVAMVVMGILPAQAEALKDWQYDEQTRSLTLILPDSVVPLISVVAPDQLVLELPNTQVGNVMGQSIRDGLVESIVLEQATPETVWVVMDFAAGTVLAASQSATPLAETASGDQEWQVRPALVAASRRATSLSSVASANIPPESAASVLRTPTPDIAQSPDFSELPVLEPAMPIDEPVSVPPLNVSPVPAVNTNSSPVISSPVTSSPVVVPPLEESAASIPSVTSEQLSEQSSEENLPAIEVEVIPLEPPTVAEVEPSEPPFLGEFESDAQAVPVQQLPEEPAVTAQPSLDERIASGTESIESVVVEPAVEPVADAIELEPIQPSNVSRWPEPIPFGQPLPR
ncbi:MAG: hypothetical protein ACFB0D_20130 [Phormidesmis sp.]